MKNMSERALHCNVWCEEEMPQPQCEARSSRGGEGGLPYETDGDAHRGA